MNDEARLYISRAVYDLKEILNELLDGEIHILYQMAEIISSAFMARNRVFFFGNGGSAADAQHIAAEFVNRFEKQNRPPLPAIALTTDTSVLTSISNDFDFDIVFTKQLQALAYAGDVAFGISTSGSSKNVISALRWAKEHGLNTLGFAGAYKTEMDTYCDLIIHVPSSNTPRVQECHILLAHILCGLVERIMYGFSQE